MTAEQELRGREVLGYDVWLDPTPLVGFLAWLFVMGVAVGSGHSTVAHALPFAVGFALPLALNPRWEVITPDYGRPATVADRLDGILVETLDRPDTLFGGCIGCKPMWGDAVLVWGGYDG